MFHLPLTIKTLEWAISIWWKWTQSHLEANSGPFLQAFVSWTTKCFVYHCKNTSKASSHLRCTTRATGRAQGDVDRTWGLRIAGVPPLSCREARDDQAAGEALLAKQQAQCGAGGRHLAGAMLTCGWSQRPCCGQTRHLGKDGCNGGGVEGQLAVGKAMH